jgi:uncharacterized protein YbjT (DUF2867 family)
MNDQTIVVMGATGQQGGAAARHLRKNGWRVRALVRDPNKDAAQTLWRQGVELAKGDMQDRRSLDTALHGAYGVFSVQNYWLPEVGFEGEVRQGKLVADAAKAAGVKHFVYSSVGAAHRGEGQKHFESKALIEEHIKALGLPYTILRPVFFMDNANFQRAAISNGMYVGMGLPPDKTIQMIGADDIGGIAAVVFANPQTYLGKTLEIAGDQVTESQFVAVLGRVVGRPVRLVPPQMPAGQEPSPEQLAGFRFFSGKAYDADIAAVRRMYPSLRDLEHYLRDTGWANLPVLKMPQKAGSWG